MEQAFFCLGCFAIATKIAIKSSRIECSFFLLLILFEFRFFFPS